MAERFLSAYGLEALLADPRFASNEARVLHGRELDAAICDAIGARTVAENLAIIESHKLTAGPVYTVADIEQGLELVEGQFFAHGQRAHYPQTNTLVYQPVEGRVVIGRRRRHGRELRALLRGLRRPASIKFRGHVRSDVERMFGYPDELY